MNPRHLDSSGHLSYTGMCRSFPAVSVTLPTSRLFVSHQVLPWAAPASECSLSQFVSVCGVVVTGKVGSPGAGSWSCTSFTRSEQTHIGKRGPLALSLPAWCRSFPAVSVTLPTARLFVSHQVLPWAAPASECSLSQFVSVCGVVVTGKVGSPGRCGRSRTCDAGVKVPCLTVWPRIHVPVFPGCQSDIKRSA